MTKKEIKVQAACRRVQAEIVAAKRELQVARGYNNNTDEIVSKIQNLELKLLNIENIKEEKVYNLDPAEFLKILRDFMNFQVVSTHTIASESGVAQSQIFNWLHDKQKPNARSIKAVMEYIERVENGL